MKHPCGMETTDHELHMPTVTQMATVVRGSDVMTEAQPASRVLAIIVALLVGCGWLAFVVWEMK